MHLHHRQGMTVCFADVHIDLIVDHLFAFLLHHRLWYASFYALDRAESSMVAVAKEKLALEKP